MAITHVETYLGCKIYYYTPPDVPYEEGVYSSPCITGFYFKKSAVKKRICIAQGGTWDGTSCSFEEPEPEWTYHSTYRGFDIESYTEPELDRTSYRVFLNSQWYSSTSLATVQGYIDDYINPDTRIFIETYRGINIYYGPYADMYYYTVEGIEHWQPTLEQARGHIDTLLEEPEPPGDTPCPNPENLWPWYGGQPYYAVPIWKETYKEWNVWHLAEIGAVYGITKPDCVAYSQSSFRSSVTAARAWIDELAEPEPEPGTCKITAVVTPAKAGFIVKIGREYAPGKYTFHAPYPTGTDGRFTWTHENDEWPQRFKVRIDAGQVVDGVEYMGDEAGPVTLYATQEGSIYLYPKEAVGIPTTLTLSAPDKAGVGEKFNISGILYETETVIPIPNQPINHSYNGKTLGTSTTGVDGDYLKEVSVPETGVWTLKSDFIGTETLQASNSKAEAVVTSSPTETLIKIVVPTAFSLAVITYCLR